MIFYLIYNVRINLRVLDIEDISLRTNIVGVFLKIFSDYIQILSSLSNVQLNYPGNLATFKSFLSNITNLIAIFYPLDCVLSKFLPNYSAFYKKTLIVILISAIIPLISIIFWNIYSKLKRMSIFSKRKKIWISTIVICYNFQPTLINTLFAYQNCVKIDGKNRVKTSLKETCWEDTHLLYFYLFVLPNLFIWMVFLPGYLLFLLRNFSLTRKNKTFIVSNNSASSVKHASIIESTNMLAFCSEGFKPNYYFWEFALLIRKYFVIIFSIFPFSDSMIYNIVCISMVFFMFLILQILKQPYEFRQLNDLALFYNITLYLMSISMIFLYFSKETTEKMMALTPSVLANILFLIFSITFIIIHKKSMLKIKLNKLKTYLRNSIQKSRKPLEQKIQKIFVKVRE